MAQHYGTLIAGGRRCPPARASVFTAALCAGGCALGLAAENARAADVGDRLTIDTTVSHGLAIRVKDFEPSATGINSDDGARNFGTGLFSNTSRVVSEFEYEAGTFGAFGRVQGFIDFANRDGDGDHKPLPAETRDRIADDVELLDLYVTGAFDAGETAIDARLGNHVLNWGESTFIQNGINVINPFDVARLRKPGAELRDGLLPIPMASVSVAATPELSVEGFYQLAWVETAPDPSGSYFSINDYATPGGSRAFIAIPGFPVSDQGGGLPVPPPLLAAVNADLAAFQVPNPAGGPPLAAPQPPQAAFDVDFLSVSRSADREPRDFPPRRRRRSLLFRSAEQYRVRRLLHQPSQPLAAGQRDVRLAGRAAGGSCRRRSDIPAHVEHGASHRRGGDPGRPGRRRAGRDGANRRTGRRRRPAGHARPRGGHPGAGRRATRDPRGAAADRRRGADAGGGNRRRRHRAARLPHGHRPLWQDRPLFRRISRGPQGLRLQFQHLAGHDRLGVAGRIFLPSGCAAANRRGLGYRHGPPPDRRLAAMRRRPVAAHVRRAAGVAHPVSGAISRVMSNAM